MSETKPTAAKRIAAFQQRIARELDSVGRELSSQLARAAETYKVLTSVKGGNIWANAQYTKVLAALGLTSVASHHGQGAKKAVAPRKPKTRRPGRSKRVSDEVFLAAIKKAASIAEVSRAVGVTTLTASKRLKALAKGKKATSRKAGVKVLYTAS